MDFDLRRGEVLSLISLETGGLTLLIDAMLGLHRLAEGEIKILGMPARDPRALDRVGTVRRRVGFPANLTVREIICLVQTHYSRPVPVGDLLARFSLKNDESRVTGDLSMEESRWLSIALAFAGDPDLLLLDHPTTGMDLSWRLEFWQHISEFVDRGGSVLYTTHLTGEVDRLANRVFVFREGVVAAEGEPAQVVTGSQSKRVWFQTDQTPSTAQDGLQFEQRGEYWCVDTDDTDHVIRALQRDGIEWRNLWINPGNLETALLNLNGKGDDEG